MFLRVAARTRHFATLKGVLASCDFDFGWFVTAWRWASPTCCRNIGATQCCISSSGSTLRILIPKRWMMETGKNETPWFGKMLYTSISAHLWQNYDTRNSLIVSVWISIPFSCLRPRHGFSLPTYIYICSKAQSLTSMLATFLLHWEKVPLYT